MDVLGISGRLVKSGKEVVTAGEIVYGGSRHVGTAVIQVCKKFPEIRSSLNIKYDPKIISNAFKLVLSQRNGPVHINFPRNILSKTYNFKNFKKHKQSIEKKLLI